MNIRKRSFLRRVLIGLAALLLFAAGIYGFLQWRNAALVAAHIKEGKQALKNGDLEKALAALNEAIQQAPGQQAAYLHRARVYSKKRLWKKVIADCDRVTPDADAYELRAEACWNLAVERDDADYYRQTVTSATAALKQDDNRAMAYYYRAMARARQFKTKVALADAERAVALAPKDARMYLCRGLARGLSDEKKALADFDKAIELDPRYARAFAVRGQTWLNLDEHEKALADCRRAVELDPNDEWIYAACGSVLAAAKKNKQALADFGKALELNPRDVAALCWRAGVYLEMHEPVKARRDVNAALKINPKSGAALAVRAVSYLLSGRRTRAGADMDSALKLHPSAPELHLTHGMLLQQMEKYAEAIAAYTRCIKQTGKHFPEAFLQRGACYLQQDKLDLAGEDAATALRHPVIAVEATVLCSVLKAKSDDNKGAAALFDQAVKRDRRRAFLYRGDIHLLQKEYAKAVDDYSEEIRLAPEDAEGYLQRAAAYFRMGSPNTDAGLADCNHALQLAPHDVLVWQTRALGHSLAANLADAIGDCSKALELDPECVPALVLRARAHLEQKSIDDAIKYATQAIELESTEATAWAVRGSARADGGYHEQARQDLTKAAELDSQFKDLIVVHKRMVEQEKRREAAINRGMGLPGNWPGPMVKFNPAKFHFKPPKFEMLKRDPIRLDAIHPAVWVGAGVMVFVIFTIAGFVNQRR